MSIDRRACGSPAPHVTRRLFAILVLMIGLLFMFAGYLLGHTTRNEFKRSNDMLTYNLTIAANNLYKKAKKITPKMLLNDSDKTQARISDIFDCRCNCGAMEPVQYELAEFVRFAINYQVLKLMKTVHNATLYLDSLS